MTFEDWKNDNWPQDFSDDHHLNEYIMKIAKDAWDTSAKNSFPTQDRYPTNDKSFKKKDG